ncbi:hypothetical protein RND71_003277 [Anisodus tanguticus]|uniref:Uncharacterized protein n=1 Tax=Anisodus tanguticus TaxID=243964 RepID=A0AAE1SWD0_9SOLA|nr:hypothetical protein RND71_003277 [Anisodus tanguticus]
MWQNQSHSSSFRESIKALEADVQHANTMAAALARDLDGDCVQMKVSYGFLAPFLLFLIEWMDYSCLDTLPSCLALLHILVYKVYVGAMLTMSPQERKERILWYIRSQSCPFCRGSLTRVNSRDLWVLTSDCDVVDSTILAQENLRRFYLYIDKLPLAIADTNVMLYDYMI